MSIAKEKINIDINKLNLFIPEYRKSKGWSQEQIAEKLGVTRVTVARWENGEAKPSILAIKLLKTLLQSDPHLNDEISFKDTVKKTAKKTSFEFTNKERDITPSPYVVNGPKDQNDFHKKLIEMQQHSVMKIDWDTYKTRLSLVKHADSEPTSQFSLEAPKAAAKTWSSNYGSHGWHRYVGRFPPQLVRALLNHFQATPDDIVCDPFTGSGTTLVEARLLGIPAVGIEVCPLSCLISRTKTTFPTSTDHLYKIVQSLDVFYYKKHQDFLAKHGKNFTHADVLKRKNNNVQPFTNIERWFTPIALLGVSIVTEFATQFEGYEQDFILTALSSKMRSIGNVDVNVIRAEYTKSPRENVDVLKLVRNQLLSMMEDVEDSITSHNKTIGGKDGITIIEASVLDAKIRKSSISHIITSPPYGVESLSYLRTHLLSYRSLGHFLKTDPYEFGKKVIGSEYLPKDIPNVSDLSVAKVSKTYREFFTRIADSEKSKNHKIRVGMMMQFFQDMENLVEKFDYWLKPGGNVAFVIGNKRIEDDVIPTDTIMSEIFQSRGFEVIDVLGHKLKTNNSNSRVPWQDKIIDQEFTMIFKKSI